MKFEHLRVFGVAVVLLSSGVVHTAAQGVGLPPLFDTSARNVQNTLQVEGAVISSGAAAYDGSVGLRFRRDFEVFAFTAGAGVLSDGGFGYAVSVAGQLKPGRWVLVDGSEKALAISAGPIVDLNVRAVDAIGHAYTAAGALALAVIPSLPGFTAELTVAPRIELRSLHQNGSQSTHAFGVQIGAAAGVARFVQVLVMADWVNKGLAAPNIVNDGGWSLGLGLRHRLPST